MGQLRKCPACGYERGFHIYFDEKKDGMALGLICPSCGQSYEIGWRERDISSPLQIKEGPKF